MTTQRSSPITVGVNACAPGAQAFTPTDTYLSVQRLEDLYLAIPLASWAITSSMASGYNEGS